MKSAKSTLALALAGVLILAGCGKSPPETPSSGGEPAAPAAAADAQQPSTPADPTAPAAATNAKFTAPAEFTTKSLTNSLAQADLALGESYNRALTACQIGDYARAVAELRALAKTPGLTPEQERAVQDLLEQTLKAAAEPSLTDATNDARPGGAEFTRKSLASPFAQAGQALKESYDSALVAVQIGDYDRAVSELRILAETPDLTPEQQRAVQDLMAQSLKAAPELAPSTGAAAADAAKPETPK